MIDKGADRTAIGDDGNGIALVEALFDNTIRSLTQRYKLLIGIAIIKIHCIYDIAPIGGYDKDVTNTFDLIEACSNPGFAALDDGHSHLKGQVGKRHQLRSFWITDQRAARASTDMVTVRFIATNGVAVVIVHRGFVPLIALAIIMHGIVHDQGTGLWYVGVLLLAGSASGRVYCGLAGR